LTPFPSIAIRATTDRVEAWVGWTRENWFSLVQSVGIVGGLLFTARSLRITQRESRVANTLELAQHHRELWADAHRRPDLARLFDPNANLSATPPSVAEREFLEVAIYHFATCFELATNAKLVSEAALEMDARAFFSRPLPLVVWNDSRASRDPRFVDFIEGCLRKGSQQRG
jgi:hypothetical protein